MQTPEQIAEKVAGSRYVAGRTVEEHTRRIAYDAALEAVVEAQRDLRSEARDMLADLDDAYKTYDLATDGGNRETVHDYEALEDADLSFAERAQELLRSLVDTPERKD